MDKSYKNPIKWIKDAWILAKPYWNSNERFIALGLILVVIICNLLTVYMTVAINKWYNGFYNTLQTFNKVGFYKSIIQFMYLAFFYIIFQVISFYFRKFLEIRWRLWLTKFYIDNWFNKKAHYKIRFLNNTNDNPDQRISEDTYSFISQLLELTLGFLSAVVSLASFVIILWHVGGSISFVIHGTNLTINGYMVWVSLLYACIGTWITFKLGKPLIKLDFQQEAYEANFRYALVRVRENSENIAFYDGENAEKYNLITRFTNVVSNFVAIIYRNMKINIFNSGYTQIAIIFPMLVSAPRYFAKIIKLGDMMQINSAFSRVIEAMSFFMNIYTSLASFRAVMDRLQGFQNTTTKASNLQGEMIIHSNSILQLQNIRINLPNGQQLSNSISFNLTNGDKLLVSGNSGVGKTTLLRVIAGLWPYFSGKILQKDGLISLFIAQKPYLPLGTLRHSICYPKINKLPDDAQLVVLLKKCKLEHLIPQLHIQTNWSEKLSLGEQQRIGFCRILINIPDIVYLDEATSALDEITENEMYKLITEALPQSVIVSIGHRSTIKKWHTMELNLNQFSNLP